MITPEAPPAPKLTRNESLKSNHTTLAGTIAQTLASPEVDHFTEDDYEFLKFHGVYQQDDRDKRKVARQWIFMVRTKFPGGVLGAQQYLACDGLSSQYANNTLRITTRQDFQFHGIIKSGLRQTIKGLNDALVTTIAGTSSPAVRRTESGHARLSPDLDRRPAAQSRRGRNPGFRRSALRKVLSAPQI